MKIENVQESAFGFQEIGNEVFVISLGENGVVLLPASTSGLTATDWISSAERLEEK